MSDEVLVIGGGWSGLAAAYELARAGRPVRVLESARQLGGRARNAPFNGMEVDNGQHLLIGAYRETLRLLHEVGVDEDDALLRLPLILSLVSLDGSAETTLKAPRLPAPLHLAAGLLTARGLSVAERMAALRMSLALSLSGFRLSEDCSVSELLQRHRQPPRLIQTLWEPLCLAALNTPAASASASVFLHVLRESFARRRSDSDLLIPRQPLGELFARPLAAAIEAHGGRVETGSRAVALVCEDGKVHGVRVRDAAGEHLLESRQVILALPHYAAARLLDGVAALSPLSQQLGAMEEEPVVTLYLQYDESVRLQPPMRGAVGGLVQWLFDRREVGQPGLMAVVISGSGEHMQLDNDTLTARCVDELRQLHGLGEPLSSRVIRERRATFHCGVDIESNRPGHTSAIGGLWLAGDYTQRGYPSTLEAAVQSGVQCARLAQQA